MPNAAGAPAAPAAVAIGLRDPTGLAGQTSAALSSAITNERARRRANGVKLAALVVSLATGALATVLWIGPMLASSPRASEGEPSGLAGGAAPASSAPAQGAEPAASASEGAATSVAAAASGAASATAPEPRRCCPRGRRSRPRRLRLRARLLRRARRRRRREGSKPVAAANPSGGSAPAAASAQGSKPVAPASPGGSTKRHVTNGQKPSFTGKSPTDVFGARR